MPVNEAPELPEETLDLIVQWLQKPITEFAHWSDWRYKIITMSTNLKLSHTIAEGEIIGPIATKFYDLYDLRILRELVYLRDGRWWVEMAIRLDTGEPIASVNHEGSLTQFLEEMHNK